MNQLTNTIYTNLNRKENESEPEASAAPQEPPITEKSNNDTSVSSKDVHRYQLELVRIRIN